MEYTDGPGTDGAAGFGYAVDSAAGAGESPDRNYKAIAKEINQGIVDGHTTQLDHPAPGKHINFGGSDADLQDGGDSRNGKRLSPTKSKLQDYVHLFVNFVGQNISYSRKKVYVRRKRQANESSTINVARLEDPLSVDEA